MEILLHFFINFPLSVFFIPTWISYLCNAKTVFSQFRHFQVAKEFMDFWEVTFEMLLLWANTQEKINSKSRIISEPFS